MVQPNLAGQGEVGMEVDAALCSGWEQLFCSEILRTSSSKGPSCLCGHHSPPVAPSKSQGPLVRPPGWGSKCPLVFPRRV